MIRVLVVDDSAVVRRALADELSRAADIQVVATAADPYAARDKILRFAPDVLTLDIEMPRMDGLTFLRRLMQYHPMPVVIVSSQSPRGGDLALQALELGAVDVVPKPESPAAVAEVAAGIIHSIRTAVRARGIRAPARQREGAPSAANPASTERSMAARRVIAIGASTGGTEAIRRILEELPADCPGVVVAQHMPEGFTAAFARRLDQVSALNVREATDGDAVIPGRVLIAPGNSHLVLLRSGTGFGVRLRSGPKVHHQRPSVDVLFHSVANSAAHSAIGVLLTGMGVDGAQGLLAMRDAGGVTLAQDEASSVVFGMPREAIRIGASQDVVPLEEMAERIMTAAVARPNISGARA